MKRMTEEKAEQMLAFIADKFDTNNLPFDDAATFPDFDTYSCHKLLSTDF